MGSDPLKVAAAVREALSPLFDGVPAFDVPMGADAKSVREMWELGEARIPNLATAMENNGVVIVPVEEAYPKAAWVRGLPVVAVPQMLAPCDRRYAVLRSLGELLGATEEGAKGFAREFLMPEKPFGASARRMATVHGLVGLKRAWKSPFHVVASRLIDLGRIDSDGYTRLMKQVSFRSWMLKMSAEEGVDPTAPGMHARMVEMLVGSGMDRAAAMESVCSAMPSETETVVEEEGVDPTAPGMHARMLETLICSGMSREAVMDSVRSTMPSVTEQAVEEACGLPQGWMSWGKVVAFHRSGQAKKRA